MGDLFRNAAKDKQEFLDWLESLDFHIDEDEWIYEVFIGWDDEIVMRFIKYWDFDLDTLVDTLCKFGDMLEDEENEKDPAA